MNSKSYYSLAIVGTCGLPARYGGFETLASELVEHIAADNFRILVFGQNGYQPLFCSSWRQVILPFKANGVSSIPYDIVSLLWASLCSQTVLLLGVSGCVALPVLRILFPGVTYIVHIDGLEWSRPKWSSFARWFLRISERIAIHVADAFIVDNIGIADYVARSYGRRYLRRSFLVAYGAKPPTIPAISENPIHVIDGVTGEILHLVDSKYLLVLARAEPENNIEMIIEAFILSGIASEGIKLVLVTNAFDTLHGAALIQKYSIHKCLCFAMPVYDWRIVRSIRSHAMAYVHGHSAGGTNPSLVEALAAERPILAFDVPYNRYTTFGLVSYFQSSIDLSASLSFLAREGLEFIPELGPLVRSSYDWKTVAGDYRRLFDHLVESDSRGVRLLCGRAFLRFKRKSYSFLVLLLLRLRGSCRRSSRQYESDLPRNT